MTQKTILLVGGGTGGHLFPLYPLAKILQQKEFEVHLIVNNSALDKKIINDKFLDIPTLKIHFLKTYKIDYHLSFRNLIAPFKILESLLKTKKLLKKIKPQVVFFKGGFVGFPVLIALKYLSRYSGKIYVHDSDITPGILTKFIGKNADQVFSNFGKNSTPLFYWPAELNRVRTAESGLKILVFGGSQGSQFLNHLIVQNLDSLTKNYQITLVSGSKNEIKTPHANFEVYNFMPQDNLIKALHEADLVICRSGASLFQVLAAHTKCIAVPLPASARNHQLHNAQYFSDKNLCYLLKQNSQTHDQLPLLIEKILADKKLTKTLENYQGLPQVEKIVNIITK